jgi:hypothetical protein
MKLLNAFSLSMLGALTEHEARQVTVRRISLASAREKLRAPRWSDDARAVVDAPVDSAVGHADTARILSSLLDLPVPMARVSVTLSVGESAIIAQVVGGRLPEGTTVLPEGTEIHWLLVTVGTDQA